MSHAYTNQLFLASAGTGKTFRLSAHFVGLLLEGVPPERILATTFTRKAAGEILGRVLQRLVGVATDQEKANELSSVLGRPVDAQAALALLPALARRIHRFQVRTLDAHTIQLAKLFEAELGLPTGWSIVDEVTDQDLQDEALNLALADADEQEWMTLLRGMDPTGDRRGVFRHMTESIRTLRDVYLESSDSAWDVLRVPEGVGEDEWAAVLNQVRLFEDLPKTKAGKPNANWLRQWTKVKELLGEERWSSVLLHGLLQAHCTGAEKYYGAEIPAELSPILDAVAQMGLHHLIHDLRERNLATRDLLEKFERSYTELKRQLGQLRFDDIPRLLDPLREESLFAPQRGIALEEIWLRMDGQLDHLLLDEFQDTSSVQWRTMEPIVEEITSTHGGDSTEGRTFFCVGDPKQSIYGWRQAEPRLLQELPHRLTGLEVQTLQRNYRSSPLIMQVTNQVFQNLLATDLFSAEEKAAERAAAHTFQEEFPEHEAAHTDMGGLVQYWQVASEEKVDAATAKRMCLELAAKRVAQIRSEASGASIGVLFRSRAQIATFLHLLSSEHGLRASGEGGNPLTDSEAVSVIASMLHMADHPRDMAAAFHVATSPLAGALGFTDPRWGQAETAFGRDTELQALCEGIAAGIRQAILREGASGWLLGLNEAVQENFGTWDQERFDQLIDACDRLAKTSPLRPGLLARKIRETRVPSPWSASIQAMTMHASKGLEFDAVVLPDLDGGWFQNRGGRVGKLRPNPALLYSEVSMLLKSELGSLNPQLQELAEIARTTETREILNLLYVAITRAKRRLEFVAGPSNPSLSYSNLLRQVLVGGALGTTLDSQEEGGEGRGGVIQDADNPGGALRWECETESGPWWDSASHSGVDSKEVASVGRVDSQTPIRFRGEKHSTQHRSPSQITLSALGDTANSLGNQRGPNTGEQALMSSGGLTRGTCIHGLLEQVGWCPAGEIPKWEVRVEGVQSSADARQTSEWAQELAEKLTAPGLSGLFLQPSASAQVFCERRFLFLEESGVDSVVWSGSMDRVVVEWEGSEAIRARVIDYKTGLIEQTDAEIVETNGEQLRVYRRAVARQFSIPEEAVELTLALIDKGTVLVVP